MKRTYLPNSACILVTCVLPAFLAALIIFTVMPSSAKLSLVSFSIHHILDFFLGFRLKFVASKLQIPLEREIRETQVLPYVMNVLPHRMVNT